MITATAFSIERRVMMSRGLRSRLTASTSTRADSWAEPVFSSSGLAMVDEYSKAMPSASKDEDMVLAVYMPPQEPDEGQALRSMPSKSSFDMRPAGNSPTASKAEKIVRSFPFQGPGLMVPPYT